MTTDFRAPIGGFLLIVMALAFLDMAMPKIKNFSIKSTEPQCASRYIGERGIWIDRAKDNPKQNFCK